MFVKTERNEELRTSKDNNCEGIVWLTGEKASHDKIEQSFPKTKGFKISKKVENWECSHRYFVHGHSLWPKEIK